ncbi:mannitol dehydrogenase family protein [Rhodophyticola porphyridii]|uniref:Mannitol dehydrogenase family protein n=1 Tax=Rhodophyticola porphyridii TaxID=1852017 RepID=A0A3L9Y520_9RHOB|nr:mannitol dehydrogenase family protein [Rhodophyticola porphyridii]RMA43831.1 mannitol dehydrogenase family protein [Rhodophyticola porphyridii]
MRLSPRTLAETRNAARPAYDRARVTPGIVHLGLGNFHRAHQAVYVDDCLGATPDWGIRGVSLRRPDMRDALAPQSGLYTLAIRDGEGTRARIIGAVLDVLVATEAGGGVLAALCDPAIRIVSLTVTEKGYCRDGAGDLAVEHPAVAADLATPESPGSVPGLLVEALRRRRAAGVAPFTVLSCDNLPDNGATLARIVAQFARQRDAGLADWIAAEVAFPGSMVDRIVPATGDGDLAEIAALTGVEDAWPVVTEPFCQWVIEDRFPAGRPDLASAGVEFVDDVALYEKMKLRMLNGAHSTLAYLGHLRHHETVADVMQDAELAALVAEVMREAAGTLPLPAADLAGYAKRLQARFRNPALHHRTAQIAMDGSQKLPQRLLAPIAEAQAAGRPWAAMGRGVAGWIAYLLARDGTVEDPLAGQLRAAAAAGPETILSLRAVFGDLADARWFTDAILAEVARLRD